jgi:uncharacterized repeat protein (TIGR03803 family)
MGKTRWLSSVTPAILLALVTFASTLSSAEWKEKVLYSFQGGTDDGALPVGGVVFGTQGNLYGVLQFYGPGSCGPLANECGAVFQLAPPAHQGDPWTETLIYEFQGKGGNDGESPNGGLVIDGQGNLYGVTAYGGTGDCVLLGVPAGCGTVYKLSPPKQNGGAWKETILYSFPTAKQGYFPNGNLVFDGAGNLYGATTYGGGKGTTCDSYYGGNCGTVFKLSPPKTKGGKWTEKVLHGFVGIGTGKQFGDGANPNGGLILDSKGAIYGTAYIGGYNCPHSSNQGCGTAFKLQPPTKKGGAWTEKALHRFSGQDGGNPAAGVVFDGNGNLNFTTVGGGGGNFPSGTVVQLVPRSDGTWTEHMLHSFQDNSDGGEPRSGLVFDSKGNLYGAATAGGTGEGGTIFRLRLTGDVWAFTTLYDFTGAPDGAYPSGSLIFDAAGNLYGTTADGGAGQGCGNYGCGTVFELSP